MTLSNLRYYHLFRLVIERYFQRFSFAAAFRGIEDARSSLRLIEVFYLALTTSPLKFSINLCLLRDVFKIKSMLVIAFAHSNIRRAEMGLGMFKKSNRGGKKRA